MRTLTVILMLCMSTGGAMAAEYKSAVFAGGCFWCLEAPFDALPGVIETESGYTGGSVPNPTYEQVSSGTTGHVEAMRVVYDPQKISFEKLLEVFWRNIDPTDGGGQFCDRGPQYRSAIFFADPEEEALAKRDKARLEESRGMRIATEILPGAEFYSAEEYHQDYYKKNPLRYHFYRQGCGRDQRLRQIWGAEAGG
jgi:peptide-methionine (S)-S-oxide reductase